MQTNHLYNLWLSSSLSLFVTLSSIANIQLGFAIKGATSFSCQEKLQVTGECYTAVEVGQKLCLHQLLVREYAHAFHHSVNSPTALGNWRYSSNEQNDRRLGMPLRPWTFSRRSSGEVKIGLARVQAHCLLIKPPPTQLPLQQQPKDQPSTKILPPLTTP